MDELLAQFLLEAPELLQAAAEAVLALERDGADAAALDAAFRAIHTLKGSAALFDMAALGEALHAAEDRLGDARAGRGPLAPGVADLLLQLADAAEAWIAALGPEGAPPPGAAEACRALTAHLRAAGAPARGVGTEPAPDPGRPAWAAAFLQTQAEQMRGERPRLLVRYTPDADAFFRGEDPVALIARTPGLLALELAAREPWPDPALYDPYRCNLVLTALAETTREAAHAVLRWAGAQAELVDARAAADGAPGHRDGAAAREPATRGLRVDPARVDALLAVAEEIAALTAAQGSAEGAPADAGRSDLDRLVGELHAAALQLRLAPLSRTFERLPRLVRELGARLGKPVRLEMEGEALEADRTVVDALAEPLIHLVRNAMDHGVEPPARRTAAGKPAQGRVGVRAWREGSELRVEVADDGGGVDLAAVHRAAAAQGISAQAQGGGDALQALFAAGVSTAAEVSEVSGRGVGMDAVKRAVEALGGRVALASRPGLGTAVTLALPVSAALMRLLVVRVGEERYAVPIAALAGVVQAPAASAGEIAWRGGRAPVRHLHDRLGLSPPEPGRELRLLVVATGGGGAVAMAVDAFEGQTQAVVRPLTGLLAGLDGMLGVVQTDTGAPRFVLDLAALLA